MKQPDIDTLTSVLIHCETRDGCLTQADKQLNIRQYLDTSLTTTFEDGPVMEMPVERAEYVHPPVQGYLQHRIILFIVGNQPSTTLWINQLREILKSLYVLLDVRRYQRPEGLQAGLVQHSSRFAQQKRLDKTNTCSADSKSEQENTRHAFRAWVGTSKNISVENDSHFRRRRM